MNYETFTDLIGQYLAIQGVAFVEYGGEIWLKTDRNDRAIISLLTCRNSFTVTEADEWCSDNLECTLGDVYATILVAGRAPDRPATDLMEPADVTVELSPDAAAEVVS